MEHSDRGRYVTDQVQVWILNDGACIGAARMVAEDGAVAVERHLWTLVTRAAPHSGAWHTGQELAPNDRGRVDWEGITRALLDGEDEW